VKGLPVTALIVLAIAVAVLLVVSLLTYNGLKQRQDQVDSAWRQIDLELKRRHDLLPDLVETVRSHAAHEGGTLEAVTDARGRATGARGPAHQAAAEGALTGVLKSLFAVTESYPSLQTSQDFVELQRELVATEDRAAYARQYYNDVVLTYNHVVTTTPQRLLATIFQFRTREYFQAGGEERGPVRVRF
jgi:LemA protein